MMGQQIFADNPEVAVDLPEGCAPVQRTYAIASLYQMIMQWDSQRGARAFVYATSPRPIDNTSSSPTHTTHTHSHNPQHLTAAAGSGSGEIIPAPLHTNPLIAMLQRRIRVWIVWEEDTDLFAKFMCRRGARVQCTHAGVYCCGSIRFCS